MECRASPPGILFRSPQVSAQRTGANLGHRIEKRASALQQIDGLAYIDYSEIFG